MKKTIILAMFAALCTLTAGCADDFKTVLNDKYYEDDTPSREPDITEQTLTLGSYNLWISGKGTGDYLWTNRRTVLAQSIVKNKWDIFGFQEANGTIQNELPTLVGQLGHLRLPRGQRKAANTNGGSWAATRRTASAAKRWASPTTPNVSS